MDKNQDNIYSYIVQEEAAYIIPIPVGVEGYEWGMWEHINTSVLYKSSKFREGADDNTRPFKNIIRPILNLSYRAEGFDVKDILLFVNSAGKYFLSFLVRKFYDTWARDNNMDTFIDDIVETYTDFGGVLIQKTKEPIPRVIKMESIAFCDQSNILSAPIGIKHYMSPKELRDMEKFGWGDKKFGATLSIEELIIISKPEKTTGKYNSRKVKTPGKFLEVYEVHGDLPESYLKDDGATMKYVPQLQFVTSYIDDKGEKQWNTIFKIIEREFKFKFLKRGNDFGRALGFGGIEELFQPQMWTNYDEITKKEMLDAASKIIHVTDDPSFPTQNRISDLDNGEILTVAEGRNIKLLDTRPVNFDLFERNTQDWQINARQMGGASETALGTHPPSGTPFKLEQLVARQTVGEDSLHGYRQGKIASFVDEVHRDWIIPHIAKELSKDQEFLSELDLDELQLVASSLVKNKIEDFKKEKVLKGELFDDAELDIIREKVREDFMSGGKERFLKTYKEELKGIPLVIKTNIAGKQKDMLARVDKLNAVFSQVFSSYDPQTKQFTVLQDPKMAKLFNEILQNSDLSPIDFGVAPPPQPTPMPQPAPVATPALEV